MTPPDDCVFCGIVHGSVPSSQLVDTEAVLAFMDIDPVTPGHMLVISKEHLPRLADLSEHSLLFIASAMLLTALLL